MTDRTRPAAPARHAAFTIVELLVTMAIIVLLLAILLPGARRAREVSKIAICAANQAQLVDGVMTYATDNFTRIPPMYESKPDQKIIYNHWPRWFHTKSPDWGYWQLGYLWRDQIIRNDGRTFFCPGMPHETFQWESYAAPKFPASVYVGATGTRLSYYYNPVARGAGDRTRRYHSLNDMDSDAVLVTDSLEGVAAISHLAEDPDVGWNVARGDGSVGYVVEPSVREDMRTGSNLTGTNYTLYDKIVDKLRGRYVP